ncbi:MAG: endolytic transglycosylase MltG [Gammaproteobacteria bacterium]|nr:endolytic transglycosylase MltG [Gammaproteobacteria bacterium]
MPFKLSKIIQLKIHQLQLDHLRKLSWRNPYLLAASTGFLLMLVMIIHYQVSIHSSLRIQESEFKYEVGSGSNLTRIVHDLKKQGFIEHPRYLLLYAKLSGSANKISTGEYLIKQGVSAADFMDQILSGKVIQYSITIVEGWNIYQLLDAIKNEPNIKHTLQGLSHQEIMKHIGYPETHPEGRFYPDTYHFPRGLTDVEFLKRAYVAMEKKLAEEWDKRATGLPYKTPYEALTMASIVEKETGQPSERKTIAGVFVRRIEKRMRLQTDPTVIYGLLPKFDGNIRRRDLRKDTPYNTYRRRGLPPTPIAMPGGEAIHAAMHPADGKELYFVSKGDGSHYFSATLEEHNRAVIKYQLKGRKKSFSSFDAKTGKAKK